MVRVYHSVLECWGTLAGGQEDTDEASLALISGRGPPQGPDRPHQVLPCSPGRGCPQACDCWPGPFHQSQQELAEAAKWPRPSPVLLRRGEGEGEGEPHQRCAHGVIVMVTL